MVGQGISNGVLIAVKRGQVKHIVEVGREQAQHPIVRDGPLDEGHAGVVRNIGGLGRQQIIDEQHLPGADLQEFLHEIAADKAGPADDKDSAVVKLCHCLAPSWRKPLSENADAPWSRRLGARIRLGLLEVREGLADAVLVVVVDGPGNAHFERRADLPLKVPAGFAGVKQDTEDIVRGPGPDLNGFVELDVQGSSPWRRTIP